MKKEGNIQFIRMVKEGVLTGKSIRAIADATHYMFENLNSAQMYNKVKKQMYKLTKGAANGCARKPLKRDTLPLPKHNESLLQHKIDEKYEVGLQEAGGKPAKSGVQSIEQRETGEATFVGFLRLLEGTKVTREAVMEACNADPKEWQVISYTCNAWQGQTKKSDDTNGVVTLWQFKITLRPYRDNEISMSEVIAHFDKRTKGTKNTYLPVKEFPKKIVKNKMLEINLCDLHLSKLAWAPESGENYDHKIARNYFFQIIDAEIERLKSGIYEKILFVWTNDFFNSDTIGATTTAGTQQNTDIRWQKMFLEGVDMLVEAIDKLQQYAPVETFYIASNHSRTTEWYMINYLYAWFRSNKRVKVDVSCGTRYYIEYGINLIGFSHSSYEKKQNLPHLMSIENPEAWGRCSYREFHLAHIHSEEVTEKGGIIFRWLPSVTGADSYHYDCGYIGAVKRSYSFTWDKKIGLISINPVLIIPCAKKSVLNTISKSPKAPKAARRKKGNKEDEN